MFDHIREYILKFNREKIDSVTGGDHHSDWVIGASKDKAVVEDKINESYCWPCLANETAMLLVDEYVAKGMKKGKCEKGATAVYLRRAE